MQKRTKMLVTGVILVAAAATSLMLDKAGVEDGAALTWAVAAMIEILFWSFVVGPRNGSSPSSTRVRAGR
jgi:hypothetical protein